MHVRTSSTCRMFPRVFSVKTGICLAQRTVAARISHYFSSASPRFSSVPRAHHLRVPVSSHNFRKMSSEVKHTDGARPQKRTTPRCCLDVTCTCSDRWCRAVKVALCQILVGADKAKNIENAANAVKAAKDKGAQLAVLPVRPHCFGPASFFLLNEWSLMCCDVVLGNVELSLLKRFICAIFGRNSLRCALRPCCHAM